MLRLTQHTVQNASVLTLRRARNEPIGVIYGGCPENYEAQNTIWLEKEDAG